MGGVIFIFLLAVLILILITPAIREALAKSRAKRARGTVETPHEAVVRRLDDHRARRNSKPSDRGPDA